MHNGRENTMNRKNTFVPTALASAIGLLVGGAATATEPCGDFGECKVLVEINASDGDIGFHFLMDGDDLRVYVGQRVREGEIIAQDRHGEIIAPMDGLIFMPLYQRSGNDGFFIVEETGTLD